jgi:hypothetical protein
MLKFVPEAANIALSLRQLIGSLFPALVCGEFHAAIRSTAPWPVWSRQDSYSGGPSSGDRSLSFM